MQRTGRHTRHAASDPIGIAVTEGRGARSDVEAVDSAVSMRCWARVSDKRGRGEKAATRSARYFCSGQTALVLDIDRAESLMQLSVVKGMMILAAAVPFGRQEPGAMDGLEGQGSPPGRHD